MTVACDRILFLQWIACHANSSELAFYISKRRAGGFPHLPDFSSNPPSTPAPPDIQPVPLRDLQCQTHSPKGRMLRFVPHVKNSVSDLQKLSSELRTKIKCSIYLVKNERRTEKSENLMLLFEINVFCFFCFDATCAISCGTLDSGRCRRGNPFSAVKRMVKRGPKWNRSEIVFFQHFQGQALPPYLVGYHHIWKVPWNQPGKIQEKIIIFARCHECNVVFEKIRNRTVSEAQNDLYGMIQTRWIYKIWPAILSFWSGWSTWYMFDICSRTRNDFTKQTLTRHVPQKT